MRSITTTLASLALLAACTKSPPAKSSTDQNVNEEPKPAPQDSPQSQELDVPSGLSNPIPLATCCDSADQLKAMNGQRVAVRGVYRKVSVSRRPRPVDLGTPGTASVDSGPVSIMLGVYYRDSGVRSLEEIQAHHETSVVVVGVIHARTPEQMHEGVVMQTMIGPYIEVETIEAASP